jgi:hypothetical protein
MTKQRFKAYVQQAQKERDRRSAAQVLKKLVQVREGRCFVGCVLYVCVEGEGVAAGASWRVCSTGPQEAGAGTCFFLADLL